MTPPPPLTLTGGSDPGMTDFLNQFKDRLKKQEDKENESVKESAQRATDLANRDIYDSAAGTKQRRMEQLLERGIAPGPGVGSGQMRAIDEAAQTRSARAASDIGLAREAKQDALNAQREGAVNALYSGLGGFAQVPFQQGLQSNQQAYNAWQALENAGLNRARFGEEQRMNNENAGLNRARFGEDQRMNNANLNRGNLQDWLALMRGIM